MVINELILKNKYNISFILIVFILSSKVLYCQSTVYHPFPENYGRWVMRVDLIDFLAGTTMTHLEQYVAEGDTTIGSQVYKKVTVARSTETVFWVFSPTHWPPHIFGPSTYSFAYRNDIPNKKVYIFKEIDGIEKDTLWYDFNLTVGDTIDNIGTYSFNGIGLSSEVKWIDSVNICNEYHKVFHFKALDPNLSEAQCYLIEGVGFSRNFIQSEGRQFSAFENTEDYYTTFYCTPISIGEINSSVSRIELFPNPVENTLQIKLTEKNTFLLQDYSILDCLGKVVFSGSISDNNIDVSMLEKGLYFLRIEDKEKNIFQSKFVKQ